MWGDALREDDVDPDPIAQFRRWYDEATDLPVAEPDAMIVATATPDGAPSARVVLLRGLDERGFVFYTSYESRKGKELAANARAAVLFHWPELDRQVRATGPVERVADDESDAYWHNRPRASRISAWASDQSAPIASRDALEARAADVEARFGGEDVPRPPVVGWLPRLTRRGRVLAAPRRPSPRPPPLHASVRRHVARRPPPALTPPSSNRHGTRL